MASLSEGDRSRVGLRLLRFPSLLEYFSYIFHHSSFLVGPVCSFKDYMDFIMGEDMARAKKEDGKEPSPKKAVLEKLMSCLLCAVLFSVAAKIFPADLNAGEKSENGKEPSPKKAVLEKLMSCLLCAVLFSVAAKIFPADLNADPHFIANSTLFWRMAVSFFVMFIQRLKYYFAWIIADVGNNACGLGFNGYDSNGKELWNRVTNVNVVELEDSNGISNSKAMNGKDIPTSHVANNNAILRRNRSA
ncbi:PREDICTED: membrane-bound O-acyltransferase domain-containing protein 2-like [Acropora digitifera]|uniref:membrane-bound O-acyltransferase domain-containing protein 2-like n=1 Tax=Acropora digitifera TaxID=70779 RepID=UPI00077B1968|nr:PREDICTED: membrane-bound O-acyltransferase domain-containing protein 2-like [Acropora digitifera]